MSDFKPKAWVKTNCPFSFKFRLFMTEAGLLDKIDFVELEPKSAAYPGQKAALSEQIGKRAIFPMAEIEPGKYLSDSDGMIAHFANIHGIDEAGLPTLAFYRGGLFPTFLEMFEILASPLGWIARLGRRPRAFY